jgi:SAM-dependent methyltransferase
VSGHVMIDKAVLANQYGDQSRLDSRQALWRLRPGPSLYDTVLDLAALDGRETVIDVGCGNGAYLRELVARGHTGRLLGLDYSPGMAGHSRAYAPTAVADVQFLPVRDNAVDVVLCLHMLYHVPDIEVAVAQLRRVVRRGGQVIVATNGPGHMAEVKAVLAQAARAVAGLDIDQRWDTRRASPAYAREVLGDRFDTVTEHRPGDTFVVTDPAVLVNYVASWPPESVGLSAGDTWQAIVADAGARMAGRVAGHGGFTVTSELSVFVCR